MPNFDASVPFIARSRFPANEQDAAGQLDELLTMLNYYVRCFEADVQLYEVAAYQTAAARDAFEADPSDIGADARLEVMDGWPVIAARDGAIAIYNFGQTIYGIDNALAHAPALRSAIDHQIRRQARKAFEAAFPRFAEVRHGVAHSADKGRNLLQMIKHAFTGDWSNEQISFAGGGETVLIDVLNQRQYSNTWEGKVISYRIEIETLEKLVAVRDAIYRAIAPAT